MAFMKTLRIALLIFLSALSMGVLAQEAAIRKNLSERLPNLPPIDEVSKTPIEGLFEVRVNQTDIFYTDAQGNYLIQGSLIDVRARVDLTEQRLQKLTAVDFKDLPLKDAFTIVRGNGKRQMALFSDPNCGFCKRFERDLLKINDVTVHVFLYPILGPDSIAKSRHIWCAKDKEKAYLDWMLNNVTPTAASCETGAIDRNVAFGRQQRINGTPASFFIDGSRLAGAVGVDQVARKLAEAKP
jgi:thiol:disulfide interchange protein DsbC